MKAVLIPVLCVTLAFWAWAQAPDMDSDGMSDEYETFFGLNPSNAADAALNDDADALINAQEAARSTDPWESDTDADGWLDHADSNALSRAFIGWGEPLFTSGDDYSYVGPAWWTAAFKTDGEWMTNPVAWHVSAAESNGVGSLNVQVDRVLLTNDLRLRLGFFDGTGASLYVDLYDTNALVVASNLFDNLMAGSNCQREVTLNIPFATHAEAIGIHLRRGFGDVTVYESLLYVDRDGDGLDEDQEAQLGTSDLDQDSDGDGLSDFAEVFHHGTGPAMADTDGDGLNDGAEINTHASNPAARDSDQDGIEDGDEVRFGGNPATSNQYATLPFTENSGM